MVLAQPRPCFLLSPRPSLSGASAHCSQRRLIGRRPSRPEGAGQKVCAAWPDSNQPQLTTLLSPVALCLQQEGVIFRPSPVSSIHPHAAHKIDSNLLPKAPPTAPIPFPRQLPRLLTGCVHGFRWGKAIQILWAAFNSPGSRSILKLDCRPLVRITAFTKP